MITVNIHEAKTHLSRLLTRVDSGEEVIIAKAGKPVARIIPLKQKNKKRIPGTAKGHIIIKDDFFAPLPEDIIKAFEK